MPGCAKCGLHSSCSRRASLVLCPAAKARLHAAHERASYSSLFLRPFPSRQVYSSKLRPQGFHRHSNLTNANFSRYSIESYKLDYRGRPAASNQVSPGRASSYLFLSPLSVPGCSPDLHESMSRRSAVNVADGTCDFPRQGSTSIWLTFWLEGPSRSAVVVRVRGSGIRTSVSDFKHLAEQDTSRYRSGGLMLPFGVYSSFLRYLDTLGRGS